MKADLEDQVAAFRRAVRSISPISGDESALNLLQKTQNRSASFDDEQQQPSPSRKSTGVQTRIEMLKFSRKVRSVSDRLQRGQCDLNGRATGNNDPFG